MKNYFKVEINPVNRLDNSSDLLEEEGLAYEN